MSQGQLIEAIELLQQLRDLIERFCNEDIDEFDNEYINALLNEVDEFLEEDLEE